MRIQLPFLRALASLLALVGAASNLGCTRKASGGHTVPTTIQPSVEQPPAAQSEELRVPLDLSFAGREGRLAFDAEGKVHAVYIGGSGEARGVQHRALEPLGEPVSISPPETQVNVRGEVLPVFEILADGSFFVAYPVRLPGKWKGEIRWQRSVDRGQTWSSPEVIHDDTENFGSHGFLDGARVGEGNELLFSWLDNRTGHQGLRVTRLSAEGIEPNQTADPRTCQCCGTAVLAQGQQVWVAYRDLVEDDVRDISLVRSVDGGVTFGEPRSVSADGWKIQGCPHTGPRMAVSGTSTLSVVWFTGALPGIAVATSRDGGESFGPRVVLATPKGELQAAVHPDIGHLPDGRLIVVYEATRNNQRRLEARVADASGVSWAEPVQIAGSGVYPRLIGDGSRTVLGFTRQDGEDAELVVQELSGSEI